ncbi:class C beta-lactamase [Rhodopila sp.]|uniref:class C beta-lactamase n=1 Tax=Rhodopila sp. TaxID=2480087 RepID=UPI003D0C745B
MLLSILVTAASPAVAQVPDRTAVDAAVRSFMKITGAPGAAVGIVTSSGTYVFTYGVASKETGIPVDGHTLFEIGSVSKTFTVTLAAYAAETGALKWDDPVSRHLPYLKGTHLDQVSLLNLATHTTGGMPLQLPDTVKTSADLTAYYQGWVPPSPPGTVRTYANPSIGLLGVATASAMKGGFAALARDKVIAPLGLAHTYYAVPKAEERHYAQGYTRDGRPVRLSPAPLATEAYGVRTTAGDLLRFVGAQLGLIEADPQLRRALAATHVGYFRAGPMTQAPIWEWYPLPVSSADFSAGNSDDMVLKPNPVTRIDPPLTPPAAALVNKTGATNGFGTYIAFIPGRRVGLVVLANRNHPTTVRLALARQIFVALGVRDIAVDP